MRNKRIISKSLNVSLMAQKTKVKDTKNEDKE